MNRTDVQARTIWWPQQTETQEFKGFKRIQSELLRQTSVLVQNSTAVLHSSLAALCDLLRALAY